MAVCCFREDHVTSKTDVALVALARQGNQVAFGELITRHEAMVKRITQKLVHSEFLAQELAQETMLQAYLSLRDLRDVTRFQSWLYGIAINVCKQHLRAQKIDFLSLESLTGGLAIDAELFSEPEPDPQEVAETRELHRQILAAVNGLSTKNRAATLLFYYDQLKVEEIAAILGVSITAVKGRLHKSRRQLKEHLFPLVAERGLVEPTPTIERRPTMIEVKVVDVVRRRTEGADSSEYHHIVTLLDEAGKRLLFIWIGEEQAENIILHLLETPPIPRPMTYTLMTNLLAASGAEVAEVRIDTLNNDTFIATIKLQVGDTAQEVDARPSDAINLALRAEKPIYVAEAVMAKAGVDIAAQESLPTGRGLEGMQAHMAMLKYAHPFTGPLHQAFSRATQIAVKAKHPAVDSRHLWLGLVKEENLAAHILAEAGVDLGQLQTRLEETLGEGTTEYLFDLPVPSPEAKQLLDLAVDEAQNLQVRRAGTEHLLLALLQATEDPALTILTEFATLEIEVVRESLVSTESQEEAKDAHDQQQQELVAFVMGE